MPKKSITAGRSAPAASPLQAPAAAEISATDRRLGSPASLESPLAWLNDTTSELWRAWFRIPQFETREAVASEVRSTTAKRSQPPDVEDRVDSPSSIDRLLHATMGRFTLGVAPAALWLAYADWAIHLWSSPGKCQQLVEKGGRETIRFLTFLSHLASDPACPRCIEPLPQDNRFRSGEWQQLPFKLIYQAFLLNQEWWHSAMTGVGGVSHHHEQVVAFVTRQLLDTISPVNFVLTNPEVLAATLRRRAKSCPRRKELLRGLGAGGWR